MQGQYLLNLGLSIFSPELESSARTKTANLVVEDLGYRKCQTGDRSNARRINS
ncbi:MAG TPA: hypothetical protein V6D09_24585 [Leptolyngbyaceae cyanobacterium]